MLEHPVLLIHDWQAATTGGGAPAWTRAIASMARQPLGFVRLAGETGASWFSWLRTVQLDLFETDDAAHLMTMRRSWALQRSWDVLDADECHIGTVHPKMLMTGDRRRLGFLDFESEEKGRVLDHAGQLIGAYVRKPEPALELTFMPQATANPFLRMMILASVLTIEPVPC